MRRRFLQGVPPSADGGLLCPRRQSNQNAAGDGSDGHFVPIVAFPRTPLRGTPSCFVGASFPARKIRSAWVRFRPGPLGPWVCKNFGWCGSLCAPGFDEPTLPVQNSFPLGEGGPVRTLDRMRGTVPIILSFRSTRRGGTPGPPAPKISAACRARRPGAPPRYGRAAARIAPTGGWRPTAGG